MRSSTSASRTPCAAHCGWLSLGPTQVHAAASAHADTLLPPLTPAATRNADAARPFAHAYAQLGRLDRLVQRVARLRAERLLADWDSFHHDQRMGHWFRAFSEGFCRSLWQETEFFRAMFAASDAEATDAAAAALVRPERCTAAVAHEAILPLVGALPRRLDASPSVDALEEVAKAVAAFAEGLLDAVGTRGASVCRGKRGER